MKLKQKMFMKIFMKLKIYLILVTIHEIQSFLILLMKKLIDKMKDEFIGKTINEFVGLKSKMYYLVNIDGEENKKAKGVNKNVAKNTRHKKYVNVLFNKKLIRHSMKRIQSKLHRTGTYNVYYFHKDVKSQ